MAYRGGGIYKSFHLGKEKLHDTAWSQTANKLSYSIQLIAWLLKNRHTFSTSLTPIGFHVSKSPIGIRIDNNFSHVGNRRNHRPSRQSSPFPVPRQAHARVIKVLVDNADHAVLAMIPRLLRAVIPDGGHVPDHNLEHVASLALLGGELEAREET